MRIYHILRHIVIHLDRIIVLRSKVIFNFRIIKDKVYEAHVKEKEQAKMVYQAAVRRGETAGHVEMRSVFGIWYCSLVLIFSKMLASSFVSLEKNSTSYHFILCKIQQFLSSTVHFTRDCLKSRRGYELIRLLSSSIFKSLAGELQKTKLQSTSLQRVVGNERIRCVEGSGKQSLVSQTIMLWPILFDNIIGVKWMWVFVIRTEMKMVPQFQDVRSLK